jgi:hypothetical protein
MESTLMTALSWRRKLNVDLKVQGFKLKVENNLTDYLSCCLIENKEKSKIFILQPH